MPSRLGRVRERLGKIVNWACLKKLPRLGKIVSWACLEKLPLYKLVVGIIIYDFLTVVSLMIIATLYHFLYVNPAGKAEACRMTLCKASFVNKKWYTYLDIYTFRRHQPWEHEVPIDWNEERRQINETRYRMDIVCSKYEQEPHVPGDPGDYIKETVGHPNSSGYNEKFRQILRLNTAVVLIMYFSQPLLLLSIWWKKQRMRLVTVYIFCRSIPPILLLVVVFLLNEPIMCALDVIRGVPLGTVFTILNLYLGTYELLKFFILALYCLELTLAKKRRDYGFRRRRIAPKKTSGDSKTRSRQGSVMEQNDEGKLEEEFDAEKDAKKSRRMQSMMVADHRRERMSHSQGQDVMSAKALAREILELGGTTEDESSFEARMAEAEKRHSKHVGGRKKVSKEKKLLAALAAEEEGEGPKRKLTIKSKVTFDQ